MGGAFTAMEDVSSEWYNPAGLGSLRGVDVDGMYTKGLQDSNLQDLVIAAPMPFGFVTDEYPVVAAFGARFSSAGDITFNPLNSDGSLGSVQTLNAERDMILSASFAQHFFDDVRNADGKTYLHEHYFGVTAKYIQSTLVQQYTGRAAAVDMGYLYKVPELGANFGVSVMNLGSNIKYDSQGDPLPTSVRGGTAWTIPFPLSDSSLTLAGDAEYFTHEGDLQEYFGAEFIFERYFAARLGYRLDQEAGGLTLGFGLKFSNLELDYGWAYQGNLSTAQRVELRLMFNTPWKSDMSPHRPNWQQIIDAPTQQDLDKRMMPSGSDKGLPADGTRPNELPVVPGWMR